MPKIVTESEYIQRITKAAKGRYVFDGWQTPFKNAKTKAVVRCLACSGVWPSDMSNLFKGSGCPDCSGNRSHTTSSLSAKINSAAAGRHWFVDWAEPFKGAHTKAVCHCPVHEHNFTVSASHLLGGRGCPMCSKKYRQTAGDREAAVNALPGLEFVRWDGGYLGSKSRAVIRCTHDGFSWSAPISHITGPSKTGCPQCAGRRIWTPSERIQQVNAINGVSFLYWDGGCYLNSKSRAVVRCDAGHQWAATPNNLLTGFGCPTCAEYGYQPGKSGHLYVLRSECGAMVKVGITNKLDQRHKQLARATPFNWDLIELVSNEDGASIAQLEKDLHARMNRVDFGGEKFDGFTEWMEWDPALPGWLDEYRAHTACVVAPAELG